MSSHWLCKAQVDIGFGGGDALIHAPMHTVLND